MAGAAAVATVALLVDLVVGGQKGSPSDFVLFLGRFHPLVVHLPIGIFLLLAAGEAASLAPKLRARVDPALGLVLPLLVLSSLVAFVLGHLLAREGGFPAQSLMRHRRLVLLTLIGGCACLAAWSYRDTRHGRTLYRSLLGVSLALLSVGAHFGATLSRGDSYLAKYAPGPLKPLLGGDAAAKPAASAAPAPAPSSEPLLYRDVVQQILEKHCVECHGADKVKGKLRLDTLANLAKGGESGLVVIAGNGAKSPLIQRMLLPPGDDDRMPPDGKAGPGAEQIALLRFWIDRGAREELQVRDVLAPESTRALLERTLTSAARPGMPEPPSEPAPKTPEQAGAAAPKSADQAPAAAKPAEPEAATRAAQPAPRSPGPRAILAEKCEKCHGPNKQKGKLRVDSKAALLLGGRSGPAIVPGKAGQSELLRRVRLPQGDDDHMPPSMEPQLSPEEIGILSAWIRGMTAPAADRPVNATKARAESDTEITKAVETAPEQAKIAEPQIPKSAASSDRVPSDHEGVMAILMNRCGECHAGDEPTAGLHVGDTRRLMAGGRSGPAVVAGKPEASLLFRRISVPLSDADHMPPDGEPQMTGDEIAAVRAWIEKGAGSGGSVADAQARPAPAAAAHGELRARPGGCGACAVGRDLSSGFELFAMAGVLLLRIRRRTRSRAAPPANS